jgi:methionyl aminopeptidase
VLCTSVNRVVVHGIPSEHERLEEGDVVGIDFACYKDGYCADVAEAGRYGLVRDFVGHGIGKAMHEPPAVPNHGSRGRGTRLKTGMVLAIEPMLNAGTSAVELLDDGWTVVTGDGSLSAHVEHSVAVTDDGPQILTLP